MFSVKNGLNQGIIRDINNNEKLDVIIVDASGSSNDYPKTSIIDFSHSNYWRSDSSQSYNQWISIELKDRWVSITHFSLSSTRTGYPLSFDVYSSNNGEDWTLIYSQKNSHALEGGSKIFKVHQKIVGRFFKFINKGQCSTSPNESYDLTTFRLRKVDLYGVITPCFSTCDNNPPSYKELPIYFNSIKNSIKISSICFSIYFCNK